MKDQDFCQIEEEIDQYSQDLQEKEMHIEDLKSEIISLKEMVKN